jgi:uncharacterized protein involved in outer membrane biogenesis
MATWHGIPRPIRIGVWSLAGLLGLAALAIGIVLATFDPDSLKPRIVEAVKQATGRDLALNGRIGLSLSLQPTLEVRDVVLANPPGYSRPSMATIERLDLKLALLPLLSHRVDIRQLILVRPDILLETDKQGHANWDFAPARAGQGQAVATPAVQASEPPRIGIVDARIENGTLGRHDGVTGGNSVIGLKTLEITAATPDANMNLAAEASYNGSGLTIAGEVGSLAGLRDAAGGAPWPVRLKVAAADAKLSLEGALAHPLDGNRYHFKLTGSIPDLSTLSPLAGKSLPALKSITFQGDLHDIAALPSTGIALTGATLSLPGADLAGELTITSGSPLSVQAKLTSNVIDADALLAAFGKSAQAPEAVGGTAPRPAVAPKPAQSGHLIPDTPIPFDLLPLVDADVTFNGAELRYGGAQYRSIAQHIALHGGKLRLDPAAADLPEGHLSGSLAVDATQTPPTVALQLHAPGLAVAPLLAAIRMTGIASGNLEVQAELAGSGGTPHDIAAGINGSLGLALADGTVDNRLLGSTLGTILRTANLRDLLERGGTSRLECATARLDLAQGVGTFRTLLLRSALLTIDGDGTINLGSEAEELRVRPRAKVGTTDVVVPLRVNGSWRSPSVVPDPAAAVTENAGTVAGAVIGSTTPLAMAAGMLGADKVMRRMPGEGVDCGASLAIARGQTAPGPPAAPGQPEPKPKPANPGDLLRQLFR